MPGHRPSHGVARFELANVTMAELGANPGGHMADEVRHQALSLEIVDRLGVTDDQLAAHRRYVEAVRKASDGRPSAMQPRSSAPAWPQTWQRLACLWRPSP